jgi:hypothetical protein
MGHPQLLSIRRSIGKALDPTRKDPETGRQAVLVALVEEHLEAQAEPEVGAPSRKPIANRIAQSGRAQARHRIRKGADSGEYDTIGAAHDRWICGDVRNQARPLQRLRDAA